MQAVISDRSGEPSPDEVLSSYRIITTRDVDEARDRVARVFCSHRLNLTSRERGLDLRHNRLQLTDVGINFIDYGAQVHITPGVLQSFYLVQMPLRGGSTVTCSGETTESDHLTATVPNATDHLDMTWHDDSPHLVVYLSRAAVERRVSELMGVEPDRPLKFRLDMAMTDPRVRGWRQLVDLLQRDADEVGATLHPSVRRHVEDAIVTGLITSQPHNLSHCLESRVIPAAPRAVRRAMEECQQAPERDVTVAEMAAAAGVSIRSLQAGFRQSLGMTPTEYLREVRLQRVRDQLCDPAYDPVPIAEVAYSWGFTHLGRFAHHYNARFGELPSQTRRGQ